MKEEEEGSKAKSRAKAKGGTSPCSALKAAYHECFNRWYTEKFLKGHWEKDECIQEWESYSACVLKRMEERKLSHLFKVETVSHKKED